MINGLLLSINNKLNIFQVVVRGDICIKLMFYAMVKGLSQ